MVTSHPIRGNVRNIFTNVNTSPHLTIITRLDMRRSWRGMKCAFYLSSLVSISDKFTLPETCLTHAKLVCMALQTAFLRICKCLITFFVMLLAQSILPLLSLFMSISAEINSSFKSISSRMLAK